MTFIFFAYFLKNVLTIFLVLLYNTNNKTIDCFKTE
ncbi:hypothetical protein HNQ34_002103 [Anoxybacillus tepidamans]|uniref:Uncharacterized protein n=1 Tax=Anoxybacteroides tepidamans TaxID=265948 RepID=A0A7W8MV80_9BACL|nr:hypothetical protein [Anoxybacillus tepidamans]